MKECKKTASVILAAGRGSRMKAFDGNKTLLPLIAEESPYKGRHPILLQILKSLPDGPKALVVNYQREAVMAATRNFCPAYCEQPELNGTGGGLLSARSFLERQSCDQVIITMGDVPLVKMTTYWSLVEGLKENSLMVLGFRPESKKQYGIIEIEGSRVCRITEWKYWRDYPQEKQQAFQVCNSGIYAGRREDLIKYLMVLESRPHQVQKEINGKLREVKEYFITDIVEYMHDDGLPVGFVISDNEDEVIGVDDISALLKAQRIFKEKYL